MARNFLNRTIEFFLCTIALQNKNIVTASAAQIAKQMNDSPQKVAKEIQRSYHIEGKRHIGYYIPFLYRQFAEMLNLSSLVHLYLVGPQYPFINREELAPNNIVLNDYTEDTLSLENLHGIDGIILTRPLEEGELEILSNSQIRFLINFSGTTYELDNVHVTDFNILEMICRANVESSAPTNETPE